MGRVGGALAVAIASTLVAAGASAQAPSDTRRLFVRDATGSTLEARTTNASLERTPPAPPSADDPDALAFVVDAPASRVPGGVHVRSVDASGRVLDELGPMGLVAAPCPPGVGEGRACGETPPIRAVADELDRRHPLVVERSIIAALGGTLRVSDDEGRPLGDLSVDGPRRSPIGRLGRHRATLRVRIVRERVGGPPPFGGNERGALELVRRQIAEANGVFGQCGVSFGDPARADVALVDPPPAHLVALGAGLGLPAAGGELRLRAEGREIVARVAPGAAAASAARALASAVERAGLSASVFDVPRVDPGADATADVSIATRAGRKLEVRIVGAGRVDAASGARVGEVDLADGLDHFTDADAVAGTLEERTLLTAVVDDDQSTIDVVFVGAFAGGGRVGESFIGIDGATLRGVVVLDRGAIRADRASFALAHEIGHVLSNVPGHPDDWGGDRPSALMDSDAASPTAFGPRRLSLDECAAMWTESGPGALVARLAPWPIEASRGAWRRRVSGR